MMATRRALAAAATTGACLRCRSSALRLLTPASPFAASRSSAATWRPANPSPPSRYFSSASTPKSEEPAVADVLDETCEQASGGPAETESKNDVPWYLQVEPPAHGIATQPPPLPDIPDGSPPIIGSVLKYAAEELGLDDLSLLDLRALDPPSALGPNLFMLFGDARSNRHIHVSASRLVKWLRYEHNIHASADGLLGPRQRKRLHKRANRRARLLGNVEPDGEAPGGLITDWICVNLGTLNRSNEDATLVDDGGRVTGFGASLTGLTIIVQIMTSERRAALGLEGLWQRSLEKQEKKREAQRAETDDSTNGAKDRLHPLEQAILAQPTQKKSQRSLRTAGLSSKQSRSFSTQRACPGTRRMSTTPLGFVPPPNTFVDPLDVQGDLSPDSLLRLQETLRTDGAQKLRVLKLLEAHLDGITSYDVEAKMTPSFDSVSAQAMQNMTLEQTWPLRLAMEYAARETGTRKRKTSLGPVRALFEELRVSATPASYDQLLRLLFCIYASDAPLGDRTKLAHELLGTLQFRVQEGVIRNDVLVTIIEATSLAPITEPKEREKTKALQTRLEELARQAKLPYMGEPLLVRLLNSYARQMDWVKFWTTWNIPPQFMQPRSEALYLYMYRLAAGSGSPRLCADTIRQCFQAMLTEEPPVPPTGRIRDALLQCIDVADPLAIQQVKQFPEQSADWVARMSNREFVGLVANLEALERQEQEFL